MTWLGFLLVAAIIAAVAAVTGIKPKGTRPVARTGLMSMARLALALIIAIIGYLIFRARV